MSLARTVLSTLIIPAFLILAVPVFLVGARFDFLGSMTNSWIRMLGLLPFAAACVVVLLGAWESLRSGPPDGRAGPRGLHSRVRNPVWLGVLVAVAAQYLLYDWPPVIVYLVVLFVVLDCLLRFRIEPRMAERHGQPFVDYLESVPRWIPRLEKAGRAPPD